MRRALRRWRVKAVFDDGGILPNHGRGGKDHPKFIWSTSLIVRAQALRLCRLAGLRKSVVVAAPDELGGGAFTGKASQEMQRSLAETETEAQAE